MGSSQYARELEQVRKKRDAAERKVNDYRTQESKKRADAEKARAAAAKTKNTTTQRSKESEAGRRLKEAQAAARRAGTWQDKVVTLTNQAEVAPGGKIIFTFRDGSSFQSSAGTESRVLAGA